MSKPLKGKIATPQWKNPYIYVKDIKSSLEWMIEQHEERIEETILILENEDWRKHRDLICFVMGEIKYRYESIMILEEGLSDVI